MISGIVGICNPCSDGYEIINKMSAAINYGDTDVRGVYHDQSTGVFFGHRKLSQPGDSGVNNQPMVSQNQRYVVSSNCAIYNSREISRLLQDNSCKASKGACDTEILLEYISQVGIVNAICKSRGVYAIAVLDKLQKKIYLVRDRAGEKPLYYGFIQGSFVFASELKCFNAIAAKQLEINPAAIKLFFRHGYIPQPNTIYKNIEKLTPGCILTISYPFNEVDSIDDYWNLKNIIESQSSTIPSYEEAKENLSNLLKSAVSEQIHPDAPYGALLSGGIDSSLIVSILQNQALGRVNTFTLGFNEESFNEANEAKEIASYLGCNHTEIYVSSKDIQNAIPLIPHIYDEPFADSSQLPTYIISKFASKKVSIAFTGDSGDELFCGYRRYISGNNLHNKVNRIPIRAKQVMAKILDNGIIQQLDSVVKYDRIKRFSNVLKECEQAKFYMQMMNQHCHKAPIVYGDKVSSFFDTKDTDLPMDSYIGNLQYLDFHTYLVDDCLVKVDRAAKAAGLETRVPLLDVRIIEAAFCLPTEYKYHNGVQKRILKDILSSYIPVDLWDRKKSGFGVPINKWLKGPLLHWADDLISSSALKNQDYLNIAFIEHIWKNYKTGRHQNFSLIWSILMFASWLAEYR